MRRPAVLKVKLWDQQIQQHQNLIEMHSETQPRPLAQTIWEWGPTVSCSVLPGNSDAVKTPIQLTAASLNPNHPHVDALQSVFVISGCHICKSSHFQKFLCNLQITQLLRSLRTYTEWREI